MKVIITSSTYYPLTDGVQSVTQYQAEGLVKLGHDVTVITTKYDGLEENEVHNGVKIVRVNVRTRHAIHIGDKKEYRELILKHSSDADVLLTVATQTATTELLYPILHLIKAKKVLYMHGMYRFKWQNIHFRDIPHKVWNDLRWGWGYLFNGKYFKQYDSVIQIHRFDLSTLFFKKHYNIDSDVIENGTQDEFFSKQVDESKNANYAINVSNYSSGKNQAMILKAFYSSNESNLELILIGSKKNKYSKYLENLKKELDKKYGNRNVKILSEVPRSEISKFVKNAKIYLMGSKSEIFPIAIVEAMAAGKPFISTDVGIVRFLPGGVTVKNSDEMAYWIDEFSKNDDVAKKLGRVGNTFAIKNFRITDKVRELDTIIRRK